MVKLTELLKETDLVSQADRLRAMRELTDLNLPVSDQPQMKRESVEDAEKLAGRRS